jgi:glyoxylase-like metal-dependent hydrolase (beta-lactamase superfamily II)
MTTNEITIGDVTVARVEELHGPVGMTPEQFFPGWPDRDWQDNRDWLVPDHLGAEDGIVRVAFQTYALRSEGRIILVDTGIGNDKTRPAAAAWDHLSSAYLENLARAGITPGEVDLVVNTHLHVDHIGWNTRLDGGQWVPTFPNATYLMPRLDFEYFDPSKNPDIAGGVHDGAFEDSVAPIRAAGLVQLWEGEHVVDGNLRLVAAPGHTPGASVLQLTSGTHRALFAGDLMHTPLQVSHPDHHSCFCEDPATARTTRRELLGWAADHTALVLPAHFSGRTALEIARSGDGFAIKNWGPFTPY